MMWVNTRVIPHILGTSHSKHVLLLRPTSFPSSTTNHSVKFSSVQSLSHVRLFVTMWIAAHQASKVHHHFPEFTQTHVHWLSDAIQPSHPLSSPSPPAPNSSQHQSFPMSQLFAWGGQSIGASALASVLPKNTQDWSISFRYSVWPLPIWLDSWT